MAVVAALAAQHGVCLASARLSVGEDGAVVAVQHRVHQRLDRVPVEVVLARVPVVHRVEREHARRAGPPAFPRLPGIRDVHDAWGCGGVSGTGSRPGISLTLAQDLPRCGHMSMIGVWPWLASLRLMGRQRTTTCTASPAPSPTPPMPARPATLDLIASSPAPATSVAKERSRENQLSCWRGEGLRFRPDIGLQLRG